MTPTPKELSAVQQLADVAPLADGDRVVISGIAGLYPQSRYIKDLENILYNKVNPVSSGNLRWNHNHPEVAQYTGNIPDLDRFDAQFFKVHYRLGNSMDPMSRKMLEQSYEAIYDAGVSPTHLSGKKVGVYIGTCFSECEKACFYSSTARSGLGIVGCNKSMFANRISYWLNATGPSMSIDDSCCSSTAALEQAFKDLSSGACEAAIVGGANLCLHPQSSVHYGRIMNISMDGKTKSFAEDAAGCAKSEAINVLFLQRAKEAKRIYADLVYVKTGFVSILNGEIGPRFGFYRNPSDTANFLEQFYTEAGVLPRVVEYVEAFGSAVPEADKSELEAIDKVFCTERDEPLLVGSVMSNIGYTEAASGISAMTKVLLGYHRGELAGNLHCETPRSDVLAIQEGRIQVVTDNQSFQRTYTAVNSMSVTGINAHVLLNGHYKPKDLNRYKTNIPRLVTISGRQETSVRRVHNHLTTHPIDPEEIALLHNIHETKIAGHLGKGFIILDTDADQKTVSLSEKAEYSDETQRQLWFVYSGMGSQWASMGAQLMRIPIFAAAIERCHKVLEPKGINIIDIITTPDKNVFNNILHSFVGIAAVQIGLTDILLELGLVPDKIIGHSVGELGCAYADGCLTAEEMIMSAYSRGRVSIETPFIRGSMAAVGIGFEQMSKMCPPEIEIACHNSAESCTISGPAEAMRTFVADLTTKGIFAKEVPCSNIAYHSRYIAEAGPGLLKYLKEVIKTPRVRSERWVSTSVPQDSWDKSIAIYCSAEYHTNNLLSPVLFEETSKLIPPNAVLVEVAPHGLLQAILKRSLPESCTNIPLTRRGHSDNVLMVLEAVGKLFMEGYNPKVRVLYPKVEFPVSTGTPQLSHFVDWAHQEKWVLPLFQSAHRTMAASCTFVITIHDDEYNYLKGHVISNKTLMPFSFAMVAVWDTLAMSLNLPKKSMSVQFREVQLYVQPTLSEQKILKLSVSLLRGNGWFEVMNETSKVATGFITNIKTTDIKQLSGLVKPKTNYVLSASDVYRIFYERQYSYRGVFRSVKSVNETLSEANVLWNNNWVAFIDGLFQLNTLKYTHGAVSQPERIGRMVIDIKNHSMIAKMNEDSKNNMGLILEAHLCDVHGRTRCGGILLENMRFHNLLQVNDDRIALQTLKFVPRFHSEFDTSTSLHVLLQIVGENINKDKIKVIGLTFDNESSQLFEKIEKIAKDDCLPGIKVQYQQIHIHTIFQGNENVYQNVDLILIKNLSKNEKICQSFHDMLQTNTFIVNEEDDIITTSPIFPSNLYNIVSVHKNTKTQLELAQWKPTPTTSTTMSAVTVRSNSDLPLLINKRNNLTPQNGLVVLTSYPPINGLVSLVRQWRRDSTRNCIHLIMVNEYSKDGQGTKNFTDVHLAYNIIENGIWGGEYYLPLGETSSATDNITLQCGTIGDLNSLRWVQAPELTGSGTAVTVHFAGINVGDVKRALGERNLNSKCVDGNYGMEFSGITERGERVMGLVQNGATRSQVMAQPELMWPVPSYWSLEDAATVPFAYVLAYYCLAIKPTSRILRNNVKQYSVLVHGGAGALGQAAIRIALARGYRVFATVGERSKKRFLLKLFPELKEEDIGNSRDASFGDLVLSATNGFGCNVIICCLNGELKSVSLRCCGPSSTVIDTAQIFSNENYVFGMNNLTNERSYVALDVTSIFSDPKSDEVRKIHAMVSKGIVLGHVRPLTRVTFAPNEASRAFRLLAASHHRGRVLLRMMTDEPLHVQPRFSSNSDRCHMIICDSNALGLQLADKLLACGVNKLYLHLKSTVSYLQYKLREWKKLGIDVAVNSGNLEDINEVADLLHSALRLGPVEGLHVITDSTLKETAIVNLDLATRTICPTLRHFAVLSYGNNFGQDTSIQRAKSGFPVTHLDLSLLETFQDADGCTWYRGALEAAERALQSSDPVLLAYQKPSSRLSLVQQIAAITDLNISNETSSSASLEELGIASHKIINAFLKDIHNTSLDKDDVPALTLDTLRKLEDSNKESQFKEVKGLGTFYSYVDPDELLATTEIVLLPTLTTNSTMRDDEFDVNETFLCIVPGLEGHHARFRTLCEPLKLPAFVLQPGLDHPNETLHELAIRYSKVILKKTGLKKKFYILGYETGVLVALELAAILEEHGQTGTVFCLGDGPKEVQALLEAETCAFGSEEALQEGVVRHMFALMAGAHSDALAESELRSCSTWRTRVDACVRTLLGRVSHSAQYARALVEAAYARIGMACCYETTTRALRSRLVLMRASRVSDSGEECSLQRYTRQALVVADLTAPMAHATYDLQVPAIINRHLDEEILQAYKNKNRCETLLMNADAFLSLTTKDNE